MILSEMIFSLQCDLRSLLVAQQLATYSQSFPSVEFDRQYTDLCTSFDHSDHDWFYKQS